MTGVGLGLQKAFAEMENKVSRQATHGNVGLCYSPQSCILRLIFMVHSEGFLAFCLPVILGGMVKMCGLSLAKPMDKTSPKYDNVGKVVFSFKTSASQ